MARAISCSSSDLTSASPALEAPAASAASFAVAFETLALERPAPHVIEVRLNRPDKSNAMNRAFWREIRECFDHIDSKEEDCRVVLLSGAGRNFTAGALDRGPDPAYEFGRGSDAWDALAHNVSRSRPHPGTTRLRLAPCPSQVST